MPSIKHGLSQQKLNTGRTSGGLSPISLNGNSLSGLGTPQVNVNAANVAFTKSPVPSIIPNQTLAGVQSLGNTLVKSVAEFNDRQDSITANDAVLSFNDKVRDAYYGTNDSKGVINFKGQDGVDASGVYRDNVKGMMQDSLTSLAPSVRQKALLRMSSIQNNALNRASQYSVQNLKIVEEDARYKQNASMLKNIEANPSEPWSNGSIEALITAYPTAQEQDAARSRFASFTMQENYNKVFAENGDPLAAYQSTEVLMSAITPKLDEVSEQSIESRMMKMRLGAEKQFKANFKTAQKKQRDYIEKEAPIHISNSLKADEVGQTAVIISSIREGYKDQNGNTTDFQGEFNAVTSSIQSALLVAANDPSHVTVDQKVSAAQQLASEKLAGVLSASEVLAVEDYLNVGIKRDLRTEQDTKDSFSIGGWSGELQKALKEGSQIPYRYAPNSMLEDNQGRWDKIYGTYIKDLSGQTTQEEILSRGTALDHFKAQEVLGTLNKDSVKMAEDMASSGRIGVTELTEINKLYADSRNTSKSKPAYKKIPQYGAGVKGIRAIAASGFFTKSLDLPSKKKNWSMEEAAQEASIKAEEMNKMLVAWDEVSKYRQNKGIEPYNPIEWQKDYISISYKGGETVGPGFFEKVANFGIGTANFMLDTNIPVFE